MLTLSLLVWVNFAAGDPHARQGQGGKERGRIEGGGGASVVPSTRRVTLTTTGSCSHSP